MLLLTLKAIPPSELLRQHRSIAPSLNPSESWKVAVIEQYKPEDLKLDSVIADLLACAAGDSMAVVGPDLALQHRGGTLPGLPSFGHTLTCQSRRQRRMRSQRLQAAATATVEDLKACGHSWQRRGAAAAVGLALTLMPHTAIAQRLPQEPDKLLCDPSCQSKLDSIESVSKEDGLKYKDIVVGSGPKPPTGYQVTVDYVAMTPQGKVFDSSLEKGRPYDVRIGSGQIVTGLDEGIKDMKVGGLRRLYIPGNLSFPKGVASAPGRPRVPPKSPVMFDVKLLYIPGLDDE